jgi:hypothetical protein
MAEGRGVYRVLVGRPKSKRPHWEDLVIGGRITLGWGELDFASSG